MLIHIIAKKQSRTKTLWSSALNLVWLLEWAFPLLD